MDILDEIFDLIQEHCEGNGRQIFEMSDQLIEEIKNDPRNCVSRLETRKECLSKQNTLCPKCGRELETNNTYERSEYQGSPADEKISDKYCPVHGDVD